MAYQVTVTYVIETAPEARDRAPKEVAKELQVKLSSSLGANLHPLWLVHPETVKVRVRRH